MSAFSGFILILLFGWVAPLAGQMEADRLKAVVAKYVALKGGFGYLDDLKVKRDVAGLTAIAKSKEPFSECAAGRAVECLPANQVVDYIRQFPLNSWAWGHALHSAAKHQPKAVILEYIKSLMTRVLPENTEEEQANAARVRLKCYGICAYHGWDDLAEMARLDMNDRRIIVFINGGHETLGEAARSYLESLRRK